MRPHPPAVAGRLGDLRALRRASSEALQLGERQCSGSFPLLIPLARSASLEGRGGWFPSPRGWAKSTADTTGRAPRPSRADEAGPRRAGGGGQLLSFVCGRFAGLGLACRPGARAGPAWRERSAAGRLKLPFPPPLSPTSVCFHVFLVLVPDPVEALALVRNL